MIVEGRYDLNHSSAMSRFRKEDEGLSFVEVLSEKILILLILYKI